MKYLSSFCEAAFFYTLCQYGYYEEKGNNQRRQNIYNSLIIADVIPNNCTKDDLEKVADELYKKYGNTYYE